MVNCRERQRGVVGIRRKYDVEVEVGGKVGTDELADALHGLRYGVVEVVDDGDPEAALEELDNCVGPDEARPAGDEDRLVR